MCVDGTLSDNLKRQPIGIDVFNSLAINKIGIIYNLCLAVSLYTLLDWGTVIAEVKGHLSHCSCMPLNVSPLGFNSLAVNKNRNKPRIYSLVALLLHTLNCNRE